MTWAINLRDVAIANLDATLKAESDAITGASEDERKQIEHAIAAAKSLIGSGIVGDKIGLVAVALSGHANPDHLPGVNDPNDSVSIFVHREKVVLGLPRGLTTEEARAAEKRADAQVAVEKAAHEAAVKAAAPKPVAHVAPKPAPHVAPKLPPPAPAPKPAATTTTFNPPAGTTTWTPSKK